VATGGPAVAVCAKTKVKRMPTGREVWRFKKIKEKKNFRCTRSGGVYSERRECGWRGGENSNRGHKGMPEEGVYKAILRDFQGPRK